MNLTFEGDDSLLRLLLITSCKNLWLARDIITYSGPWHNVFVCTLLHRELREAPVNKHNYYVSACNICAPVERLL